MARDWLAGVDDAYDVIVIGSGLGGLTGANFLARRGYRVLVLEHHYQFGGLATWFRRKGGHIFDISLHGFPIGMIKSCRKYWTREIADMIVPLRHLRFVNPQFDLQTSFDREDFTRLLVEEFGVARETVEAFFAHLRTLDPFTDDGRTTAELFEEFFPGRNDVHRLLLEPIAYANGSSADDPAVTYGIVFGNFMNKGVYIFQGGTDKLIGMMEKEMRRNGVDLRKCVAVERILTEAGADGRPEVCGVVANGRTIRARAVLSNANLKNTIFGLTGRDAFADDYLADAEAVRLNTSSCQVYIGLKPGVTIPNIGDLVFVSDEPTFSSRKLSDFHTRSRTFSLYYPEMRPDRKNPRTAIVASLNARWEDWADLGDEAYAQAKQRLIDETLDVLERFLPGVRDQIDHLEAATPRTIRHYTTHFQGTSFGTKYEGLKVSAALPQQVSGLYHAGSVGIIMSGWLGTINYGVITAGKMDAFLEAPQPVASTLTR